MIGFLIRRILQAIVVILGVVLIVFLLGKLIPGGEAAAALGPRRSPAAVANFNRMNGLDLPLYDQFWRYLWGLFHLNLGHSFKSNEGVKELISQRLPKTLTLVGVSTLVALVIAVPLGILQVVKRYTVVDYSLTGASFLFYAMPPFFLGFLLILYFSFDLHLFPVSPPINSTAWTIFTDPRSFVLPVITLAAITIASFSRYMRSSMMDALTQDYIRTARGKGCQQQSRPLWACLAQRSHPHPDTHRAFASGHCQRRSDHRDRVQLPGHGAFDGDGGQQRRHPDSARHHLGHHHLHCGGLAPGRSSLRRRRSSYPVREHVVTLHEESTPPPEGPDVLGAGAPTPAGDIVPAATLNAMPEGGESSSVGGMGRQILRVFIENKLAVVGLFVIVFFILFCFVGPSLYHTNQNNSELALNATQNGAPGSRHLLGTDNNGFDMVGRLMFGGQASLIVGFASAAAATVIGVIYGAVAGFVGGWIDAVMMRIVDMLLSVPVLFLLIALVTIFKQSEVLIILVIAFVSWLVPARLVRGETLTLRVREYVQAVRVMGGSRTRIVGRHIVPNSIGTIVVFATFQVADSILLLAALGFIGLGIPAPGTDWGTMLSNGVDSAALGLLVGDLSRWTVHRIRRHRLQLHR